MGKIKKYNGEKRKQERYTTGLVRHFEKEGVFTEDKERKNKKISLFSGTLLHNSYVTNMMEYMYIPKNLR